MFNNYFNSIVQTNPPLCLKIVFLKVTSDDVTNLKQFDPF